MRRLRRRLQLTRGVQMEARLFIAFILHLEAEEELAISDPAAEPEMIVFTTDSANLHP